MKLCIDIDWVSVSVKIYTILPKVFAHPFKPLNPVVESIPVVLEREAG